jgi:hypothetical protein
LAAVNPGRKGCGTDRDMYRAVLKIMEKPDRPWRKNGKTANARN